MTRHCSSDPIGQCEIVPKETRKFAGSPEKEKEDERGDAVAVQIQHSNKLIQDPSIMGYIVGLAENLARNLRSTEKIIHAEEG